MLPDPATVAVLLVWVTPVTFNWSQGSGAHSPCNCYRARGRQGGSGSRGGAGSDGAGTDVDADIEAADENAEEKGLGALFDGNLDFVGVSSKARSDVHLHSYRTRLCSRYDREVEGLASAAKWPWSSTLTAASAARSAAVCARRRSDSQRPKSTTMTPMTKITVAASTQRISAWPLSLPRPGRSQGLIGLALLAWHRARHALQQNRLSGGRELDRSEPAPVAVNNSPEPIVKSYVCS